MLRLGILVSGGGTNLQAILDALDQGVITNAAVSVVISNNSGAYALKRAEDRGSRLFVFLRNAMTAERNSIKLFLRSFRKTR